MARYRTSSAMSPQLALRPSGAGFTLIELAVVLVVIALLIGGLLLALSAQVEVTKIREAERQLREIKEALLGFAAVNGRLPCPATEISYGAESVSALVEKCLDSQGIESPHGFVPARTLGLSGSRNADELLADPWGNPYRYSVSPADLNSDGRWDFVTPNEMRNVGLARLAPNLTVCNARSAQPTGSQCNNRSETVVGTYLGETPPPSLGVPVIFYSLGPDGGTFMTVADPPGLSPDELRNAGEGDAGLLTTTPHRLQPKEDYLLKKPANLVFVARARSGDQPGTTTINESFDDLVDWISPNVLYAHMISAGRLP